MIYDTCLFDVQKGRSRKTAGPIRFAPPADAMSVSGEKIPAFSIDYVGTIVPVDRAAGRVKPLSREFSAPPQRCHLRQLRSPASCLRDDSQVLNFHSEDGPGAMGSSQNGAGHQSQKIAALNKTLHGHDGQCRV